MLEKPGNRGFAYVLAMILLSLFAAMAVAFTADANNSSQIAGNLAHGQAAQLDAESGLAYMNMVLKNVTGLTTGQTPQQILDAVATQLPGLIGTTNLNGQSVVHTTGSSMIDIPLVKLDSRGGGFTCRIDLSGTNLRVRAKGQDPIAPDESPKISYRSARLSYQLLGGQAPAFKYGVQSRGKITLTGNSRIIGGNNTASNASVLSGTYTSTTAVDLTGNVGIDGDVSVSNPSGTVSMVGNVSIGGESGAAALNHVHIGTGQEDFPDADPTVFEPFATNIVTASTPTNGNKTFTNIRIKANANPTFSGNITITGVVYVETPNRVSFAGNLNMTGVVVTQKAPAGNLASNYIKFTGNSSFAGVQNLAGAQWASLRALPGTFLLAPGFSVSFTGNFGTINGTMAADQFVWAGNAGGDVYGSVINWSDTPFSMTGNSSLRIFRDGNATAPPGFTTTPRLRPLSNTYEEPTD